MKYVTGLIIAAILFILSCNSNSQNAAAEKESYEKTKETLLEKEQKNPLMFLSVTNRDKHNLIGQTVISGDVTNNAKISSYLDVQLEVSFFSKTGTLLEKGTETVYDEIAPGRSVKFKFKNFTPKGTDSVLIKVLGARVK